MKLRLSDEGQESLPGFSVSLLRQGTKQLDSYLLVIADEGFIRIPGKDIQGTDLSVLEDDQPNTPGELCILILKQKIY